MILSALKKGKRILVLDFGQSIAEIVYAEASATKIKLLDYAIQSIPQGVDQNKFVNDFLSQFLKRNAIQNGDVIISVSDMSSSVVKYLTLPVLPDEEILGAARWQLNEEVPFNFDEAAAHWQVIKDFQDESGAQKRGMTFAVVKKDVIDRSLAIIASHHLNPKRIIVSPFNFAGLLNYFEKKTGTCAVLDVDYKNSTLSIYWENKLNFIRVIPIGWEKITRSLTQNIVSDKGQMALSYEEAEEIKDTFGIPESDNQTTKSGIRGMYIMSLLRPSLEGLVRELKFSFDFFRRSFDAEAPGRIYLSGGGANLKNLDTYLKKELNIDVAYFPLSSLVDSRYLKNKTIDAIAQNKITNILGATLTDPQVPDLLPEDIRSEKADLVQGISIRLFSVIIIAILSGLLFISQFQQKDYQRRIKTANMHLKTIDKIKVAQQHMILEKNLVQQIHQGKVPAVGVLKIISKLVPPEIVLREFFFDPGRRFVLFKGSFIKVQTNSEAILTQFMKDLEDSSFFLEASLLSTQREGAQQIFEMKCKLVRE